VTRPHDSWAEVYDLAYREEFGEFYEHLTERTLEEIGRIVSPPASIVDFGAGTGRLAIPLSRSGYRVTAVEPSGPMLEQLRKAAQGLDITCVQSTMQDFQSGMRFDLAICVFTVVIYLLEEIQLREALRRASDCLVPGGKLLLDVPSLAVFGSHRSHTRRVSREVAIEPIGADLHDYQECIKVLSEAGEEKIFSDRFTIRSWRPNEVLHAAQLCDLQLTKDLSQRFSGTGSRYFLLARCAPAQLG